MPKHGKKYVEAAKLIDKTKLYPILEAAELVKKVSYAKIRCISRDIIQAEC